MGRKKHFNNKKENKINSLNKQANLGSIEAREELWKFLETKVDTKNLKWVGKAKWIALEKKVRVYILWEKGNEWKEQEKYEAAFNAFYAASVLDDADSMFEVAKCYYFGIGTKQNDNNALQYCRKCRNKNKDNNAVNELITQIEENKKKRKANNQPNSSSNSIDTLHQFESREHEPLSAQIEVTPYKSDDDAISSPISEEVIHTASVDAEESIEVHCSAETPIDTIDVDELDQIGKIDSADGELIEEDLQQDGVKHQPIEDKQKHEDTLFTLGINCLVESDNNKAEEYLHQAAELGHAEAQFVLGLYYELRQRDSLDALEAYHWFRQSADQGYADACYKMGLYHLPNNLSTEEKLNSTTWFISAAKSNHAEGAYYAALSYITGVNNELTGSDAIAYLEHASEAGMVEATYLLGICYRDGAYVTSDKEKACYLFEKAAECCHAESEYQLDQCYEFGQGTTQNHRKALHWYERAAKHGNADAEKHLKSLLWVARKIKFRINMCEE